jgi:S-adenosylmethionine hydrolase
MSNLVLLTDFGNKEHFVAVMKGIAISVSQDISIFDITHEIEPYNIWKASLVLADTLPYWPHLTVFVAVVDPGVGTSRKSLAVKISNGNMIVCPDNGILTFLLEKHENPEIRMIDEKIHKRPGSEDFYTFHGRDLYAYIGARLASGIVKFDKTGPLFRGDIILLDYQRAWISDDKVIKGTIVRVEEPFGNLVTDITAGLLGELTGQKEIQFLNVQVKHDNCLIYN